MSLSRRTFLGLTVAATAGLSTPLISSALHRASGAAPDGEFAIGVREFAWSRGTRSLFTKVFYPTPGTPGGAPVPDAPLADGVFPVAEWSHGLGGNSDAYSSQTHAIASAGFICPAPSFSDNANIDSVNSGEWSRDVSEVITQTLALNDAPGDPFAGHIDTAVGVGVSGHSMGGMTTHGLVTSWPDERIAAAVPVACLDMGDPAASVNAGVLFIHGENDPTCAYAVARQAYEELPGPKAFLTHVGADHAAYLTPEFPTFGQTQDTLVDWFRWRLYDDTAARDRLGTASGGDGGGVGPDGEGEGTGGGTRWEAELA